jgi:ferric-dicitrate binding protein FerR (iron transport regulator)
MKIPSQDANQNGSDLTSDELIRKRNREASQRYRDRDPERHRERMRAWRAANLERSRELSRNWRNRKLAEGTPEEVATIRANESAKTKRNQNQLRKEVFAAYGGYVCACCGETEQTFLSIDHVRNDGAEMRRQKLYSGSGTGFYTWLRKNAFPQGFQVLCMNCQVGKHRNGGVCPHSRKV